MTRTTPHIAGGTDGPETRAAEVTVATPTVPPPRDAEDSADAPARANPVPLPRAPEPSVGADAPPWLKTAADLPALNPLQVGVVIAALLAVTLLTVFASHRTMTVQGSVTVHNPWGNPTVGGSCTGADAYSWLKPGASVTISDANGKTVGTTTLAGGTPRISGGSNYGNYADNCVFPFTLTDVPAAGEFYRVSVGNASTNGVTLTADELRTSGAMVFVG